MYATTGKRTEPVEDVNAGVCIRYPDGRIEVYKSPRVVDSSSLKGSGGAAAKNTQGEPAGVVNPAAKAALLRAALTKTARSSGSKVSVATTPAPDFTASSGRAPDRNAKTYASSNSPGANAVLPILGLPLSAEQAHSKSAASDPVTGLRTVSSQVAAALVTEAWRAAGRKAPPPVPAAGPKKPPFQADGGNSRSEEGLQGKSSAATVSPEKQDSGTRTMDTDRADAGGGAKRKAVESSPRGGGEGSASAVSAKDSGTASSKKKKGPLTLNEADKLESTRGLTADDYREGFVDEEGETVYVVESIVGKRHVQGVKQYKVRWHEFGPGHDSWEPAENLDGLDGLIDSFEKSRQGGV